MASRSISIVKCSREQGFTLFEVVIVLALLSMITAGALFFSIADYQSAARHAEVTTIITLLQSVRTQAMSGRDGSAHGVAFAPDGYNGYVAFVGTSFAVSAVETQTFVPMVYHVTFGTSTPAEVVFSPLLGTTTAVTVTVLTAENSSSSILINYEGLIY